MPNYNKVLLMGNLTRDPQLKYLPSQTAVAEFGLAVNRKFKTAAGEEREDVLFVDCAAFAKTGELINQYFAKGKPIFVEGRLKFDTWEDKNGGGKRSKLSVIVDSFQFVGVKDAGGAGGGAGVAGGASADSKSSQHPARDPNRPKPTRDEVIGNEQHFNPDDIPF